MNKKTLLRYGLLITILFIQACSSNESEQPAEEQPTLEAPTATVEIIATVIPTKEQPSPVPPAPTTAILEDAPTPDLVIPAGFKEYYDSVAGASLFIPDIWVVTSVDPGRLAILQSYPEDKYVGGEAREAGDTKCDLYIDEPGARYTDVVLEIRSQPETTIVSEQEILLTSGQPGIQLELESMGPAITLVSEIHERVIVLTCFGDFGLFKELAASLHASEILESTTTADNDESGFNRYHDEAAGVSVRLPDSWVVTGIIEGHAAIFQSYADGKYIGGEALEAADTKCDLNIRPSETSMIDFVEQMRRNSALTILTEIGVFLESGLPGIQLEVESLGRSNMLVTEISEQVVLLNCYGEPAPFEAIAKSLQAVD